MEYLPAFAQHKSPSFVGKYTSTMVRIWDVIQRKSSSQIHKERILSSEEIWLWEQGRLSCACSLPGLGTLARCQGTPSKA